MTDQFRWWLIVGPEGGRWIAAMTEEIAFNGYTDLMGESLRKYRDLLYLVEVRDTPP